MDIPISEIFQWAASQGSGWVLMLAAIGGWWDYARRSRAREDALQEKLLGMATEGSKQIFEALSTVREALIHINRSGRG